MDETKITEVRKGEKGVRIHTLNIILILIACVLYILLFYATVRVSDKYEAALSATNDYIECEKDAALVSDGSDYLTEQVQLYAVTMDTQYAKAYFEEVDTTQRREKALHELKQHPVETTAFEFLEIAMKNSNNLMERELYSMKLISTAQGYDMQELSKRLQETELSAADKRLSKSNMIEKGRKMVFGSHYQGAKASIEGNISYFLNSVVKDTKENQKASRAALKRTMTQQRILIALLCLQTIITFMIIRTWVIKPLKAYTDSIRDKNLLEKAGTYEFQRLAEAYNNIYQVNEASQALLRHRANRDSLTGIMDRDSFDQLREHLKVTPKPIALLIIDVDKFEEISDTYGKEAGAEILKKVARLLEKSFRTTDLPARIGRDEFAVVLTDMVPSLKSVIRNKVNAMNKMLQNPGDDLPSVTLSAGVAFSKEGFSDSLFKEADLALDYVKDHGRCGCNFYGDHEEVYVQK